MNTQANSVLSRRERRKEQTRQRLLEVAEQLFRTQGFDTTTVEEIATAADVAKGTLFNYFESKDRLLTAILYKRTAPILASPPGEGHPIPERIELFLKALWDELYPYRHTARRMLSQALSQSRPPPPSQAPIVPSRILAHLIREGQAQGVFRADINADDIGALIVTVFFRLFMLECHNDNDAASCLEDTIKNHLDTLYYGIMSRDTPHP